MDFGWGLEKNLKFCWEKKATVAVILYSCTHLVPSFHWVSTIFCLLPFPSDDLRYGIVLFWGENVAKNNVSSFVLTLHKMWEGCLRNIWTLLAGVQNPPKKLHNLEEREKELVFGWYWLGIHYSVSVVVTFCSLVTSCILRVLQAERKKTTYLHEFIEIFFKHS